MTCTKTRVSSLVAPTCGCNPSQFRRARRSGTPYVSIRARQTTRAGGDDELPKGTPHKWLKVVGPAYAWQANDNKTHAWQANRRVLGSDNWPRGANWRGSGYVMWFPVDVDENAHNYTFVADIPGVEKQNVKVQVDKDRMLTISGHREKGMSSSQSMKYSAAEWSLNQERRFGKFKRSWPLPPDADVSQISASVEQGVLAVIIDKKQPDEREVTNVPIY